MPQRKGLGKGLGQGYKNITAPDPAVHSMSARGIKSYQQQLTVQEKNISSLATRINTFAEQRDKEWDKEEKATKELEKKLAQVRRPFEKRIKELEKKQSNAERLSREAEQRIRELNNQIELAKAMKGKEHNIESVQAMIRLIDLGYTKMDRNVIEKPRLKNGIQIFKGQEYEVYKGTYGSEGNAGKQMWLAFANGRLVGYSLRRASEHAGDTTSGVSFIGSKRLTEKKMGYDNKTFIVNRIGFTDWLANLKAVKDPSKLKTVNLKGKGRELNNLYD